MDSDTLVIQRETRTLESLQGSIAQVINDAFDQNRLSSIVERGLFTPTEDEEIAYWFARFITLRSNLWMIVDTAVYRTGGMKKLAKPSDWQYFVLGYAAVCSLIRLDRFLLTKVAKDSIIQRKLNEAFPDHRIERKQYSKIFTQLTLPSNAVRIHQAYGLRRKYNKTIVASVLASPVETIYADLHKQERYLNLSKRNHVLAWIDNRRHALKRRGASAKQKSLFAALEYSGRVASNLTLPRPKKVTSRLLSQIEQILRPGDILVTRHNRALTNLFLPGYWPHAALYVGPRSQQTSVIETDNEHVRYWCDNKDTFEALKDGARFRRLEDTLAVDAFVVLRPNISDDDIAKAIARVVVHAGKGYNFDFDFFRSDHLVCTELIYRAYDGINGIDIPLQERMGRQTLSAEDILDFALDTDWASPIAIFGVGKSNSELISDATVNKVLHQSYRAQN